MTKRLQLAIIEKRFKKLHDVANFAKDYACAIATHAQRLVHEGQSDAQATATLNMTTRLNDWAEMFVPLFSEMQRVEAQYYATADDDTAELIEAVPSTKNHPTEAPYKMMETLCKIGYIKINGDPYHTADKRYTDDEIISDILDLYTTLDLCANSLANANYQGIWSKAGEMAVDICEHFPDKEIDDFLHAYNAQPHDEVFFPFCLW